MDIIFRSNSHRASAKLRAKFSTINSLYNIKNMFSDKSKGYYLADATDQELTEALEIKGITKARSQDLNDYGKCW